MATPVMETALRRARFEADALPLLERLYGAAMKWTRRPEDAADLVQDTLLRGYRAFDQFCPGTNCKAWLFTIMYSIFVNRYHRERRAPETISIEDAEELLSRSLAVDSGEEGLRLLRETNPWVTGEEAALALGSLPEDFRSAVMLVDIEGLSYEEAAGALGCPVGTLRSRLFRARKLLFSSLKAYAHRVGYLKGTR